MSEFEQHLVIIQKVGRGNEFQGARSVPIHKLPRRFLNDRRIQDLVKKFGQPGDSENNTSGRFVAAIIERGRHPIRVIPLAVSDPSTPTP